MGIRVSKEEKLNYCVQTLLDLYSKLDDGFGKFVTEDFSEGVYSNSLYDVGVSSTFTPLDELLVELDVDFYRKGTNTLVHRLTLGIGKLLSSKGNSVQVVRFDVWSIPCSLVRINFQRKWQIATYINKQEIVWRCQWYQELRSRLNWL